MNSARIYFFFIVLLLFKDGFSQTGPSLSNLRKKYIAVKTNPVHFDSSSVIPNTISIRGVSSDSFHVDYVNALITFTTVRLPDSVFITYRVFPFKLNGIDRHFNYDSVRFNFEKEKPYVYKSAKAENNKIIDFGNINYNGSIGRGISFGNSQDAVVNSTLNLQLNGFIGDSMELTAAITDNNIPVQPDGGFIIFSPHLLQVFAHPPAAAFYKYFLPVDKESHHRPAGRIVNELVLVVPDSK